MDRRGRSLQDLLEFLLDLQAKRVDPYAMFDPADAPDPDRVYANYLRSCEMLGIEPVRRERTLGLVQEWTEVLTGRYGQPLGAAGVRFKLNQYV